MVVSGLGHPDSRIQGKWKQDENGKQERELPTEMPDGGYHVNIQAKFYSMILLCKIFGPFCTVQPK